MISIIICIFAFLLGGGFCIAIIKHDIKKHGYCDMITGLKLYGTIQGMPDNKPITEDRAFMLISVIKERHPDISIDEITEFWKSMGYIK